MGPLVSRDRKKPFVLEESAYEFVSVAKANGHHAGPTVAFWLASKGAPQLRGTGRSPPGRSNSVGVQPELNHGGFSRFTWNGPPKSALGRWLAADEQI